TAIIYGRSDSTINRGGIRMGTSEIYRAVLALDDIVDALVVDIPRDDGEAWMPLFVVLAEGATLDDDLTAPIAPRVRAACSPPPPPPVRPAAPPPPAPTAVFRAPPTPRPLPGKALEVPVKRILRATPPKRAASRESLADPAALDWFVTFARERAPA